MVDADAEDEAPTLVELLTSDPSFPPAAAVGAKSVACSSLPLQTAPTTEPIAPLPPTPLTILTGFLGAGKTTLVGRLLRHFSSLGQRIAIVNNEASASSVEPSLVESSSVMSFGTLLTLANGCVCCSLTSDLISALNFLLQPQPSAAPFVYVLVECSGLASPGPLLEQLWVDEALEQRVYLDGVLCVVDCKHFRANLRGSEGAQMEQQLVFSDRVLVNKVDTVSDDEKQRVLSEVRRINSQCDTFATERSELPVHDILNIRAFDRSMPRSTHSQHSEHEHEHEHAADECCPPSSSSSTVHASCVPHIHDPSLVNLVFSSSRPVSLPALKAWLSEVLWTDVYDDKEEEAEDGSGRPPSSEHYSSAAAVAAAAGQQFVYRMKAAMRASDGSVWFLQSVQRLFDLFEAKSDEDKRSVQGVKLVVIGRNLQQDKLDAGFHSILAEPAEGVR